MASLTAAQVTALLQDSTDSQGVDLGQIRSQLRLTPAQRVDWLIAAIESVETFRQNL